MLVNDCFLTQLHNICIYLSCATRWIKSSGNQAVCGLHMGRWSEVMMRVKAPVCVSLTVNRSFLLCTHKVQTGSKIHYWSRPQVRYQTLDHGWELPYCLSLFISSLHLPNSLAMSFMQYLFKLRSIGNGNKKSKEAAIRFSLTDILTY